MTVLAVSGHNIAISDKSPETRWSFQPTTFIFQTFRLPSPSPISISSQCTTVLCLLLRALNRLQITLFDILRLLIDNPLVPSPHSTLTATGL